MVAKQRSTKKVIETSYPWEVEHSLYKLPGKEAEDVTDYDRLSETATFPEPVLSGVKKRYTAIHTHPSALQQKVKTQRDFVDKLLNFFLPGLIPSEERRGPYKELNYSALPSGHDVDTFLEDNKQKTEVIAVREPETGKVRGYTVVRKTKRTPKIGIFNRLGADMKEYREGCKNIENMHGAFEQFVSKYGLQYRLMPAEGYHLNETRTQFVKNEGLEQKLSGTTAVVALLGSLFFIGSSLTGNAIGSLSNITSSWIGGVLFCIGLISCFFWVKSKRE